MKAKWIYLLIISSCLFAGLYTLNKKFYKQHRSERPDIEIYGPVVMADGIGRQAAEMAMLYGKNHKVKIVSRHINQTDVPSSILKMAKAQYKHSAPIAIVHESLWSPVESVEFYFSKTACKDQIRYAYSMLESTRIMPEWVMLLNLYFDAVIVPDIFLIEVYKNSGVNIPIFHIPLGLDLENFLQQPLKESKAKKPFIFASLGSGIARKNQKTTVQAFAKALGNVEDVFLYVNCRMSDPKTRSEIIAEILKQNCTNIQFTEICFRKEAYLNFFSSVDCLLSLSKAEGFSIQPREAMALGIPVILTDNTAQSTIAKTGLVKVIHSTIAEPCHYYGRELIIGEQFNCNVEEAAAAIKDVYDNYAVYASKGQKMREWASAYDYKQLHPIYESIITPPKILLGDRNEITAEYLMTNSQSLFDKYKRLIK